jgi:acyl-CoA reductase-like NAD-dependent aldehyde dehydrogenase
VAATRILVSESILLALLSKLKTKAESITRRMGSPKNPESMMGPVISSKQLDGIINLVEEAKSHGATIVTGGKRMSGTSSLDGTEYTKGYYYPPTIITGNAKVSILGTRIWKEEAFGPVIVVVPFKTEDEAILLANDSEFGLGAAVWTQDLSQAFRVSEQIEAGICWGQCLLSNI